MRACPGAAREYPQEFVDNYLRMVRACAEQDRTEVILRSTRMGFLTGAKPSLLPARMRCPGTVLASAAKGLVNAIVENAPTTIHYVANHDYASRYHLDHCCANTLL